MLHVKQIRDIVDAGDNDAAHQALDQLLALGPNNIEALKLRARLHEFEGRFTEEAKVWERIATIDREDPDAVAFLLRRQIEDREHFYFTDDLPGGGRRFTAYPRNLVNTSVIGLIGCVTFLLASRLSANVAELNEPAVMLAMFALLVLAPWLGIVAAYFSSIKALTLSPAGIAITTRFRVVRFPWSDLEKVCLARGNGAHSPRLSLVLIPKDRTVRPVEINLNQGSSVIRARSYLVREITRHFAEPEYVSREALGLDQQRVTSY